MALSQRTRNEAFERYVVGFVLRPWARQLVELARLVPGERVLDVACCTGTVGRLAAERVGPTGAVTGLDPDGGTLDFARRLTPPGGAPITWIEAGAEAMPQRSASFDAVLCQQGLQFFADRPRGLREMHRVLVPGGRIVLSVWSKPNPLDAAARAALAPYVSDELAARMRRSTSLGDPEELRGFLVDAGFANVRVFPRTMTLRFPPVEGFLLPRLAAGPAADVVARLNEKERGGLVADVGRALRGYEHEHGVEVPSDTNLAVAEA